MKHQSSSRATVEFDALPDTAFIRQSQLINGGIVPFSASTLRRRIRAGKFPQPTKLSEQITAWRVSDVRQWLNDPASYEAEMNSRSPVLL